jgi:hypothetical protein
VVARALEARDEHERHVTCVRLEAVRPYLLVVRRVRLRVGVRLLPHGSQARGDGGGDGARSGVRLGPGGVSMRYTGRVEGRYVSFLVGRFLGQRLVQSLQPF